MLVGLAVLTAPSLARGATTFGADLTAQPNGQCGANPGEPCNFTTQTDPSGTAHAGSPVAGVVVSARIRTTGVANTVAVRVLRENAMMPFTYLNVGPEASIPVTDDMTAAGHITEAPGLHLPIRVGEQLGVGYTMQAPLTFFAAAGTNGAAACAFHQGAGNTHPVGTERSYNNAGCGFETLVQGTVEPDADGDTFGDETQDLCPTNAAVQTACPTPPGNPASPINPAGHVRKRKCKKKQKGAAAAKKKKCKRRKK